ncbi:hypothetical protein D8674_034604 [Pyrus ussuriensis x Pyrus communis]|uniref:Uncharacterized protein n=1 Tax=Pyrus ussuriensis x Pyrus communis TaxID=2448454 RepID=A0A5N5GAD7_9ROSA|nr:hypothetical protein D8674_034604 [Pyrus ussuriensis x Pyrus communis]
MLLPPVNEVRWVLETTVFDFSGDDFLNLNLPPNFDRCPDGSCEICCACDEVVKLYDQYEGNEDVVEKYHGQLYNGVQALNIRNIDDPFGSFEEVIWKHYSKVIIFMKKRLMCAWSIGTWKFLVLNWVLWNILVGHPKEGKKKKKGQLKLEDEFLSFFFFFFFFLRRGE